MKTLVRTLILFALCLFLASCTTLVSSEPTLVGGWRYEFGEESVTHYFTADGNYSIEREKGGSASYEFGFYGEDEKSLFMEGYGTMPYALEGNTLVLDGLVYKRVTRKAQNNTSRLAGVWTNDRQVIGFAKDGVVVCQGAWNNVSSYTVADGLIQEDGDSTEYLIINNTLYLKNFS